MAKLGACPGETLYKRGRSPRVQAVGNTEQQARANLMAALAGIKAATDRTQTAAYRAALALGDGACERGTPPCDPCTAIPVALPMRKWTAIGIGPGTQPQWLARGGWKWQVNVICECPNPPNVVAGLVDAIADGVKDELDIALVHELIDQSMSDGAIGHRFHGVFNTHSNEIIGILFNHRDLMALAQDILRQLCTYLAKTNTPKEKRMTVELIRDVDNALEKISEYASPSLRADIEKLHLET